MLRTSHMTRSRTMRSLLPAAWLACLLPVVGAAEEENPFKKARVGDWVEYKMTGPNIEGKTKMTIVTKDDKEVVYEVTGTFSFMGMESVAPVQKQTVDLTKSYDPIVAANLKRNNVKIEKLAEGKEKLKVGQKEFATNWTKLRSTTTVNNVTIVTDYQMWFAAEVPLGGLVRMDTTGGN